MREGIDRTGRHLYPAFPYTHLYGVLSVKALVRVVWSRCLFEEWPCPHLGKGTRRPSVLRCVTGCRSWEARVDTEGSSPASATDRARVLVFGGPWDPDHDAI